MILELRRVKVEDCELLFNWVNDPAVRKNSFDSNFISYEEHKKWFKKKLNSKNIYIYIYTLNTEPIGQIRIDIKNNIGLIDYSIDKKYRGNNYGSNMLRDIVMLIKDNGLIKIDKLIGRVKSENIASRKAFNKAGYKEKKREKHIEYCKNIK